jgi:hypothetical protein
MLKEITLVFEVIIKGAGRHAHSLDDVHNLGVMVPIFAEKPTGSLDDLFLGFFSSFI